MPVVEAVGLAAPNRSGQAARIERVMLDALRKAQAEGEKRPHVLRKRMLAARDEAKRQMGRHDPAAPAEK